MKVGGLETWKELTNGVQYLVRLLFNNNFNNPGLVRCGDRNECLQSNFQTLPDSAGIM